MNTLSQKPLAILKDAYGCLSGVMSCLQDKGNSTQRVSFRSGPAGQFAIHRIASGWHPTKADPVVQVVGLGHSGPEFHFSRPDPAPLQLGGQPSAAAARFEAVRARVLRKEAEAA